jgi:hypothetical protein
VSSIEAVCDPTKVARAFDVAGIRLPGSGSVSLERAWPNRKGGISASYRGGGELWSIHGPVDPPRSARRAVKEGRAFHLRELGCWAHRFPMDPVLPELSARIDRERRNSSSSASYADADLPRVASYKPLRRCVIETRDDRFVKLMRPEAVADVASIYRAIAGNPLLGSMSVALPESVDESRGTLVWRGCPGDPLLRGHAAHETVELIRRVGFGLGRLQRADLAWRRRHCASDELVTLEGWVSAASGAFPGAVPALRTAAAEISAAVPNETGVGVVPAHRDFHDGQLLAAGECVTLLDLDTACLAAPELDVANFLAHLRLRSLQFPDFQRDEACRSFLEGLSESGAGALDADRLRWYEATALLRIACVHAFRPRWARLSDDLTSAAMRRASKDLLERGSAT